MRHDDVEQLIVQKPKAFLLLTLIAWRARRSDERCKFTGLDQGQAMIGDYKSCGLSRQEYRTALRWLEANQFVTIKATSKGTIATVTSADVYDINAEGANHQTTIKQPSTNHQLTTNKNVKNVKKENSAPVDTAKPENKATANSPYTEEFEQFWRNYPKKVGKGGAFKAWRKERPDFDVAISVLEMHATSEDWTKDGGKYIPHPQTWINARRFEDEVEFQPFRQNGTNMAGEQLCNGLNRQQFIAKYGRLA